MASSEVMMSWRAHFPVLPEPWFLGQSAVRPAARGYALGVLKSAWGRVASSLPGILRHGREQPRSCTKQMMHGVAQECLELRAVGIRSERT
jgi:hypothetical protein